MSQDVSDGAQALILQFLAWVAEAPRTYADAEAWRRSCPHLTIWEDAIGGGLVRLDGGGSMQESRLSLTERGRSVLAAAGASHWA
jgi:hypothetical protein